LGQTRSHYHHPLPYSQNLVPFFHLQSTVSSDLA
jgi:hypothetical protein